jgi:alkaline phosphatase D
MPHEVSKMKELIRNSNAKNVIILSGDRHIAEISKMKANTSENGLKYPLYDFTSSGLTHAYEQFTSEPNQYRVSDVIKKNNFGILKFNLETNTVKMEIRGSNNDLLENVIQKY